MREDTVDSWDYDPGGNRLKPPAAGAGTFVRGRRLGDAAHFQHAERLRAAIDGVFEPPAFHVDVERALGQRGPERARGGYGGERLADLAQAGAQPRERRCLDRADRAKHLDAVRHVALCTARLREGPGLAVNYPAHDEIGRGFRTGHSKSRRASASPGGERKE